MNCCGKCRGTVFIAALLAGAMGALAQTPPVTITTTSPLPAGYVGVPYQLTFSATTTPANQTVTWSILKGSNNPPSGLTLSSSGSLAGTPAAGSTGAYTFTVEAQVNGETAVFSTTQAFTMNILASQITVVTATTLPTGFVGQTYTQTLQATSVPNLGITWSPSVPMPNLGLTLSPAGVLSGTPLISCTPCTLPITAEMTGTSVAVTTNFSLTIFQGKVVIISTSLPLAPIGQHYSAQLAATPAGVTWTLSSSPPAGLTLSASGAFAGVPTTAGAYSLTVQAALQGYQTAQSTLTLDVTNGPLGIVQTSIPVAIQFAPYQTTLLGTGGLPPYQWSTNNTLGMTIGATSGTISGTPTTLGAQSLPVTLSDSTGATFTQVFSLLVVAPVSVTTTSLPNGTIGASYSQTLQAAGGQSPYTWTLVQGSLPTGLSLPAGGTISGVPTTNGAFSFTVQVADSAQRVATKALSITITGQALTVTTLSLPNDPVGVAYSQTLAAAGGTPPYTWAIVSGSLPAGLSLNPKSGALSGTPSGAPATSTFTVQVTDSTPGAVPLTAQKAFTLNITGPALSITTTSLPNGSVGVAYSQTLQASGGTPSYTWSIASGALPGGLTLNPTTGLIGGKPTAAGPFAFVVVATDSTGQTAQQSLAITVTPALTITTGNLSGTVGSTFSQSVTASGGATPYTFALTGGTLPSGLTFTASTDLISGAPSAAGTFTVTFTVTDANKQTASATITITVNQPGVPPITFTVGTGSQPPVTLCLVSAFPETVTGTLTASFQASSSVAVGTDQSIQLILPGSTQGAGPTVSFSVPVCTQTPPPSAAVTMGTGAGTITVTPQLTANGVNITPQSLIPQTIAILAGPPVITSVTLTPGTGSTSVSVVGYSSTREVVSGVFTFAPATGSTLSQSAIPVQLGSAYTTWYQSAASDAFGSLFQLTVPFTTSASGFDLVAVTVTLTNTKGTSAACVSGTACTASSQ
jgi:hypothetical protein